MAAVAQSGQGIAQRQLAKPLSIPPRLGRLEDRLQRARVCLALRGAQRGILGVKLDVLLVRALEQSLVGKEPRTFLERLDADGGHPPRGAQLDAAVQGRAGISHVSQQTLRTRGGVECFAEAFDRPRVEVFVVEDRAQRRLGLRVQPELQLGVGDGVEARGVQRDVVTLREHLHALGDLHRLMGVAGVVLEPREVIEDLDSQGDVVEPVGQLERRAVALPGRIQCARAHEHLAEAEQVVSTHPLGHGVVEQLDSRHRVLPGAGHVTDEVEEYRQQPVAARHEVAISMLGRPVVDLLDQLPARGVLALATHHIGLDQLGAPVCADLRRPSARARRSRRRPAGA